MRKNFERKKILLCTSTTIPFNAGDGKNAFNFAMELVKYNQKPVLLSLNKALIYPSKSVINNIPIYRSPFYNRNFFQKILSRIIILPYFLYFTAKSDVLIIYGKIIAYSLLILIGKLFGKKVIFRSTLYGFDDFNTLFDNKYKKSYRKRIFNLIDYYFSLTPAFTQAYNNHFNKRQKIFESFQGVDTSVFHFVNDKKKNELRKKLNLPEKGIIIISVGFLIKRKGFDEIFEVLSKLNIPFFYVVVGDYKSYSSGILRKRSQEMSRLHKKGNSLLNNNILFAGSQNAVFEYLQATDLLLMNSEKEGLPNVLLEAMACGVVPVIKEIPGILDYIVSKEETAEVFTSKGGMGAAIKKLIENDELRNRLSQNASEFIKTNCSFEKVTEKFLGKIC